MKLMKIAVQLLSLALMLALIAGLALGSITTKKDAPSDNVGTLQIVSPNDSEPDLALDVITDEPEQATGSDEDEVTLVAATTLKITKISRPTKSWPYVKVTVRKSNIKANCVYYQRLINSSKKWRSKIPKGQRYTTLTIKAPKGLRHWEASSFCYAQDSVDQPFDWFSTKW